MTAIRITRLGLGFMSFDWCKVELTLKPMHCLSQISVSDDMLCRARDAVPSLLIEDIFLEVAEAKIRSISRCMTGLIELETGYPWSECLARA